MATPIKIVSFAKRGLALLEVGARGFPGKVDLQAECLKTTKTFFKQTRTEYKLLI